MLVPWDRSESEALADFLSAHDWPFHAGGRPSRETVLERIAAGWCDGPDARTFWIVDGGVRAGVVRVFDLADENVEFDLRVAAPARGRGLGTAAVRELTAYVFAEFPDVLRVEATTRADNEAMRRVLTRCGYAQEARYRAAWPTADGRRLDSVGYAVLRSGEPGAAALVAEHLAAFNAHDRERLLAGLHPDAVWSTGRDTVRGRAALAELFDDGLWELAPSLTVRSTVAGDGRVAAELTEALGVDAVRHVFAVGAFFVVVGGLIVRAKVYREGSADLP